jgi:hypothetical protein
VRIAPYALPVAEIRVENGEVEVYLSMLERVGALHGEIRVPLSSVRAARVVQDAWPELRGIRAPGTGLPGQIMLGTCRGSFGKDFCAVYKHRPAIIVDLEGEEYQRLIVTQDDPWVTIGVLGFQP